METQLRLPEIRSKLIESLSPLLVPYGYKVKNRRGENSFLKKKESGYAEIQFFYNDYFPIDYTVHFVFRFYQSNIQNIIEAFCKDSHRPFIDNANIIFSEGNFIDELRGKLLKYRSGYKNKLGTNEDLENTIYKYKELIINKINNLEIVFQSAEGTAEYLFNNKDLVVGNCSENLLMTSLISLKLINSRNYSILYQYYLDELPKKEAYGVLADKALNTVQEIYEYLNRKS